MKKADGCPICGRGWYEPGREAQCSRCGYCLGCHAKENHRGTCGHRDAQRDARLAHDDAARARSTAARARYHRYGQVETLNPNKVL